MSIFKKILQPNVKWTGSTLLLAFASFLLFRIHLEYPAGFHFDEFHYIPAAREILKGEKNRNWEHPPLAKYLMSGSIAIWGDQPLGWRMGSVWTGVVTVVCTFWLGAMLFKSLEIGIFVALLTLFNQMTFVTSRIAMLDGYMMAFLLLGLVSFVWTLTPRRRGGVWAGWLSCGVWMGLASASKWFAFVPLIAIYVFVLLHTFASRRKWKPIGPNGGRLFDPKRWGEASFLMSFVCFMLVPLGVYLLTFWPLLRFEGGPWWRALFDLQTNMFSGQLRVISSHPYMSEPLQWPLIQRPIWYAFDKEDEGRMVRGVLMLGNPLLMWGGLLALYHCVLDFFKNWDLRTFLIIQFWCVSYGAWFLIPRKIAFYYYYYPAGFFLSFAVAAVAFKNKKYHRLAWGFLGLVALLFFYFYPILAALQIPSESFTRWMWFQSWI